MVYKVDDDGLFLAKTNDCCFRVGETIGPVQVDADRRGYVVATGVDADAALAAATAAMRKLVVRTEGLDRPVSRLCQVGRASYLL